MFFAAFTRLAAGRPPPEDGLEEVEAPAPKKGRQKVRLQGDETSRRLQKTGVYHIRDADSYAKNDSEGPKFDSPVTYSFWSGAKYCLMLSLLLWWFPLVGNMIAGYIGGRRAGGPWRGVFACVLPVIVLMILTYGHEHGLLPSFIVFIIQVPEMAKAALMSDLPSAAPYYSASVLYVTGFVGYLAELLRFQMNLYAVAEMRRSEYALGASSSSSDSNANSNVTVNVHGHHRSAVDDDGPARSGGPGSSDDAPVSPPDPRPPPPVAVAGGFHGSNWRRRKLRGERETESMPGAAQARLKHGYELDAETGPRGEALRDSIFRIGAPVAASKSPAGQDVHEDAGARVPLPRSSAGAAAERPVRAKPRRPLTAVVKRSAGRDGGKVRELDSEGDEIPTKMAGGHRRALERAAASGEEGSHHLPARAMRKVPKLERAQDVSPGGPVTRLHRAEPGADPASVSKLFKERRVQAAREHGARAAHHAAPTHDVPRVGSGRGADDDDDEGQGPAKSVEPDEGAGADKRKDEIQKLVERALKGTGPANFAVKKEAEHNWEVL
jgi:hypothetical protein